MSHYIHRTSTQLLPGLLGTSKGTNVPVVSCSWLCPSSLRCLFRTPALHAWCLIWSVLNVLLGLRTLNNRALCAPCILNWGSYYASHIFLQASRLLELLGFALYDGGLPLTLDFEVSFQFCRQGLWKLLCTLDNGIGFGFKRIGGGWSSNSDKYCGRK